MGDHDPDRRNVTRLRPPKPASGSAPARRDGAAGITSSRREASACERAAERIVQGSPVAAIAADRENTITACNAHAGRLLGHSPSQLLGKNLQDVLQARDIFGNQLSRHHEALHEMTKRFEALLSFKLDVIAADGSSRRVGVAVTVVADSSLSDRSLVYMLAPISRRRRADQLVDQLLAGELLARHQGHLVGEESRGLAEQARLTERQREIVLMLAQGKTARTIAHELGVSVYTVRSHIRNIIKAVGAKNQLEAVAKALALHLV